MEAIKVVAPAHWASYLINGDASGFDYYNTPTSDNGTRDLAAAQAFEAWCKGSIVSCGEGYFDVTNVPTLGRFVGDVAEYTILVQS